MSEATSVTLFKNTLTPGFGGDLALVLTNLTNPYKWQGINFTVSL